MNNLFEKLGLNESVAKGLMKLGIETPTDIQTQIIPLALTNKDIIGRSQTGSGKTLAYLLPLYEKIDVTKKEMQIIILAPTHELVMQVYNTIKSLSEGSVVNVTAASIIGDANINRQIEKLRLKPHIVVGTPGRILELIKRRKISAHTIKTIIIDEADILLDINNIDGVKAVIKTTQRDRQLQLFSATITDETIATAKVMMKEPQLVSLEDKNEINANIDHYYFVCEQRDKIDLLRKLVHAINPQKALVFINRSEDIEITTSKLKYHKLAVEGIHGTNIKEDRKKALGDFRNGKIQLLVASDLASRGLDIEGITHVFNLDVPEKSINYLHRVGRCGRAGNNGIAITLTTERELDHIKHYEKTFDIEIHHKDLFKGKVIDKQNY